MEYSNLFVCLMGIGTVFIGLICIILLVTVMSGIIRKTDKSLNKQDASARFDPSAANAPVIHRSPASGEITPQLVAAVSAVLAEEMGTDVGAIRICSFRKI